MRSLIPFAILLLLGTSLFGQFAYEPSPKHPFGKANPDAPAQIRDWQPMMGICDCKSLSLNQQGNWADTVRMTWEFRYIMNGMAVQDLSLKEDGVHSGSIRQFNADSSSWYVHFYSSGSASPRLASWKGGKKGKDIVLYNKQKAPNGMDGLYKITFSDISENGFDWLGEWVTPDESFKLPMWKIFCKKRLGK